MSQRNYDAWPGDYQAAVSLTYDDGNDTQREIAAPAMEERGFLGTFYLSVRGEDWAERLAPWVDLFERGGTRSPLFPAILFLFLITGTGITKYFLATFTTQIFPRHRIGRRSVSAYHLFHRAVQKGLPIGVVQSDSPDTLFKKPKLTFDDCFVFRPGHRRRDHQ